MLKDSFLWPDCYPCQLHKNIIKRETSGMKNVCRSGPAGNAVTEISLLGRSLYVNNSRVTWFIQILPPLRTFPEHSSLCNATLGLCQSATVPAQFLFLSRRIYCLPCLSRRLCTHRSCRLPVRCAYMKMHYCQICRATSLLNMCGECVRRYRLPCSFLFRFQNL